MKYLVTIVTVFLIATMPLSGNAQNSGAIRTLQAENAALKQAVADLQKRVAALSAMDNRLKRIEYFVRVDNAGNVQIRTPGTLALTGARRVNVSSGGSSLRLDPAKLEIRGTVLTLQGQASATIKASGSVTVEGGALAHVNGGVVHLGGAGGRPVARVGDSTVTMPVGGAGKVVAGSRKVFAN